MPMTLMCIVLPSWRVQDCLGWLLLLKQNEALTCSAKLRRDNEAMQQQHLAWCHPTALATPNLETNLCRRARSLHIGHLNPHH